MNSNKTPTPKCLNIKSDEFYLNETHELKLNQRTFFSYFGICEKIIKPSAYRYTNMDYSSQPHVNIVEMADQNFLLDG